MIPALAVGSVVRVRADGRCPLPHTPAQWSRHVRVPFPTWFWRNVSDAHADGLLGLVVGVEARDPLEDAPDLFTAAQLAAHLEHVYHVSDSTPGTRGWTVDGFFASWELEAL